MSENSDFILCANALKHYSERLVQLKEDEVIKHGTSKVSSFLDDNSKEIQKIEKILRDGNNPHQLGQNKKLIDYALKLYLKDLTTSKEKIEEELGKDAFYKLDNLNIELDKIEKYLKLT